MKYGKILAVLSLILFAFVIFFGMRMLLGKTVFMLRSVDISKDFPLDREKLLSYLEIYPARPLWAYNIPRMKQKLNQQLFLYNYEIKRKYPDTLVIGLSIRKAIARTISNDGSILLIDREGIIFKKARHQKKTLPLVTFNDPSSIRTGIRISGKSYTVIDILSDCVKRLPKVYKSISQISIHTTAEGVNWYEVQYRTHQQKVVIQNSINVEAVIKGLIGTLYMNKHTGDSEILVVTENGLAYSGE